MATLVDIANYTGLAISTVSKYFNGGSLRPYNKTKIENALKVLDYRPNQAARTLKTKRTYSIGILVPNLQSSFDTHIITAIEQELTAANYSSILCTYGSDPKIEAKKLRFLLDKQVDGLALLPSGTIHKELFEYLEENKKIVLFDRVLDGFSFDAVITNNSQITEDLVDFLVMQGHREIGIITNTVYTGSQRLEGYKHGLIKHGIEIKESLIRIGSWSIHDGRNHMDSLLTCNPRLTAVIACSEELCLGTVQILREKKIHIPDDISVVGFDMYGISTLTDPAITAVEQPVDEMGKNIVDILLRKIQLDEVQVGTIHCFNASIDNRQSVRHIPQPH